ncbi:hypothetical protein ACVWXL_008732 [Bradyrhizobium sp. GM22.5]
MITATPSFEQIVPVLDGLGIALADQEHNGRGIGRRVLRQPFLPVGRREAFARDGVDVVGERKRHHVGLQSVDHGARLRTAAPMRLLDLDALAGFLLIGTRERLVELDIELARRIVRDVQQSDVSGKSRACQQACHEQSCRERNDTTHHVHLHSHQ